MANPLFQLGSFDAQKLARQGFQETRMGQIVRDLQRAQKRGLGMESVQRRMNRLLKGGFSSELKKTDLGVMVGTVQKLAGASGIGGDLLSGLFQSLGPIGSFLEEMLSPGKVQGGGVQDELKAAQAFLESHGFDVRKPTTRAGGPKQGNVDAAGGLLESIGVGTTQQPGEAPAISTRNPAEEQLTGKPRGVKMVRVPDSSNVHSVGVDQDGGSIFVTYLGGTGDDRSGKGPTYRYDVASAGGPGGALREAAVGAATDIATSIITAPSAGGAVWDELRIRGTAFGHKFPYELISLDPSGYVPRAATALGFRPRRVRQADVTRTSPLSGTGRFQGLTANLNQPPTRQQRATGAGSGIIRRGR